jgi:hypothetical protein
VSLAEAGANGDVMITTQASAQRYFMLSCPLMEILSLSGFESKEGFLFVRFSNVLGAKGIRSLCAGWGWG